MATGYLVSLGNGSLNDGDAIGGSAVTFVEIETIGAGAWIWSGTSGGATFTDEIATGVYMRDADDNVYFVPDDGLVDTLTAAEAQNPPPFYVGNTIEGGAGNDVIDETFTDVDGDVVTSGDDTVIAGAGDDIVRGFSGNDSIEGGAGADTIVGGAGEDNIEGGDDNDVIYGDFDTSAVATSESLNWINQGVGADLTAGFTQDTGNMNVSVAFTNDGSNASATANNSQNYVGSGEPQSATSSVNITGGPGPNVTIDISFDHEVGTGLSNEVDNVSFRINDVDFSSWQDILTVNAYDENGAAIAVTLTAGDPVNDIVVGQTVTATNTSESQSDLAGSVLVNIAEPVHRIEIIYENGGSNTQALWITDVHFDTVPAIGADDTISGGLGDDLIYGGYGDDSINGDEGADTVYGGDGDDVINNFGNGEDTIFGDAGDDDVYGGIDSDVIYGGTGNDDLDGEAGDDEIYGGADADVIIGDLGDDTLHGDSGADTIFGNEGTDTIYGGADNDTLYGGDNDDSISGGTGNDTVFLGAGNDQFGDWSTEDGNDSISGQAGDDIINGGVGDDVIYGGDGDDTLIGAAGDDTVYGDDGDDAIWVTDDHNTTTIEGGEDTDLADVDTVSLYTYDATQGVTVALTGDEAGTFDFDGTDADGTFSEIERLETTDYDDTVDASADTGGMIIATSAGDDSVIGGSGDDTLDLSIGADTVSGGAGDDTIDLGDLVPDGQADVVVFSDGDGSDYLTNFDAPTDNGDGTYTGLDTFDVSGLTTDGGTTPVTTADVVVSANADGDAVLHFPGGESITLAGIAASAVNNPAALLAMGIPADGIVSGTDGADTINTLYDGDPDGDLVDNNDALLAGEVGDDDIIVAGAGDDSIVAGDGNDEIYADRLVKDLIVNGSFEDLTGTVNTSWGDQGVGSVEGWTATDPAAELDLHDNGKGGTYATDGTHVLDMGGSPTNLSIYQDIAGVVDGETYRLSLDAGDVGFAANNSVDIYWNGVLIDTITPNVGQMDHFTYNLVGGSGDGSNRLQFTETGPIDVDGLQLDNIKFVGLSDEGAGNDTIAAGDGEDVVFAGAGNDTVGGGAGNDTLYGEDGDDFILNGSGNDTVYGGAGNDNIAASTGADELYGGDGDDYINGGGDESTGHDTMHGDAGNDTLIGGAGDDTAYGGSGDDVIEYTGSGDDLIEGGETGETSGDTLDASNNTVGMAIDFTANGATDNESGTATVGSDTANFFEIENVILGAGDDTVTGSTGAENIDLGAGADTIDAGAGDDAYSLGTNALGDPDGDADVVILEDGDGNDIITDFDAPTDNGDGTFTGIDTFDVSEVTDGVGPINTNDVVVGDDGNGNAVLNFPDGTSVTLIGIPATDADNPAYLNAIGIPVPDGTVSGTAGDDLIDLAYIGDPEGDFVDNGDAIIPDHASNDDLIEAGAGNDTVFAGAGNDTILGEAGNDTIYGGDGQDTINGGTGADVVYGGDGDDSIEQGEDATATSTLYGGAGDDVIGTGPTGAAAYVYGGEGNDFILDGGNSEADDIFDGGEGDDNILASGGNDTISGGLGDDTADAGGGDDTVIVSDNAGIDYLSGGVFDETTGDVLDASSMTLGATLDLSAVVDPPADTGGTGGPPGSGGGPGEPGGGGGAGDATLIQGANEATLANFESYLLGSGNDTVIGDTTDDIVDMGAGADTYIIADDFGNDTVAAGTSGGDDLIDANAVTQDLTVNFTSDENGTISDGVNTLTFDDVERIETGSGDDSITLSDGQDSVAGGEGDDVFYVNDDFDNDTLTGGEGGESIGDTLNGAVLTDDVTVNFNGPESGTMSSGGETTTFSEFERVATGSGDDTIIGGAGNEVVDSGEGNDTLSGGAGDDTLYANEGDDTIAGGTGADTIFGGMDDDDISFAINDTVDGDEGNDTFTLVDLSEVGPGPITIVGGDDGEAVGGGDTLNLGDPSGFTNFTKTSDGINASGNETFSGSATLADGSLLIYSGIENVICFTPGTLIATPRGARDIATLSVGDLVVTRDHGLQPIRWIGARTVEAKGNLAPIRIRPGVMTGQERDLVVSPQHRMLFQGYRAELLFGDSEVLIAAKHLIDGKDVTQDSGGDVTYIHMLFDEHEVVFADGAASESFHPGGVGLDAIADGAREELFTLFPDLRSNPNGYGDTARKCLKKHEANLLRL